MNWSDISGAIGKAAPLVGSLLGGKAGGAVGGLVAKALGVENDPKAVSDAIAADPEALQRIRKLELEHESDLTRMHLEAETSRLTEINKTMRSEAAANDPYVRRWRPTWGYVTAAAWFIQALAVLAVVIGAIWAAVDGKPEVATALFNGAATLIGSLTAQWGIALTVLGVSVHKRSKDKELAAGKEPVQGLLSRITKRIGG